MRQKNWWIGFNNLKYLMQWMGFKTHANWPLVTKLNLHRVRTPHFMGEFLILIGPAWPFKKLCLAFRPRKTNWPLVKSIEPEQGSNSWVIFSSWLVLSDLSKDSYPALNHKMTSGHKFEPEQGLNPLPLGWVSHPDWSCLTIQKANNFCYSHFFVCSWIVLVVPMVVLPRVLRFPPIFVV